MTEIPGVLLKEGNNSGPIIQDWEAGVTVKNYELHKW
jgi:hypothetical protein